jgi:ADP-heptose:LPS heptosyltransferase
MRKLILKNGYSPGDIVMLTAAVRDLHRSYPNQFLTDVRTACPELWEHNPYITPLSEAEAAVEVLECAYPLIDRCNEAPYHCLHGFIEFLNERLGLAIKPTLFKGDIHLSDLEKSWYSQVHELTGEDTPFWIIASGGKYDATVKWWDPRRYQAVVDHFRGRIQFVQVGEFGHCHPKLKGVLDIRGQTNLRELVRLVYHAQGVLCPITALMHLAAAVKVKEGNPDPRPCVVIAGGREPAHWEAYPGHQFFHTNGALPCCASGGCWRDRVRSLGDGDERDKPDLLCVDVAGGLPRCLDLITAQAVIRRIEMYFNGGVARPLAPAQVKAARRGVRRSARNRYDDQPLTLSNARLACEQFIQTIPVCASPYQGRGIVICGGGVKYFTCAWVCIQMLRRLGCALPIQLWHLAEEMDEPMKALVAPLGVECVDASQVRKKHPVRRLGGWELKPYAILYSPFREVLFLDADNVPVRNPEVLFDTPEFRGTGALFWPDYGQLEKTQVIWDSCGLPRPETPEFESGQIVLDKGRCAAALRLALWFNEHSDFYYRYLHGDKETFHLAFRKLKQPFSLVPTPIHPLAGTMCQHDFGGRRLFQHRNTDKWDLLLRNQSVPDFWFEAECREYLEQLRRRWDGRMSRYRLGRNGRPRSRPGNGAFKICACMISCPERERVREETLRNLAATDWDHEPVLVQIDPGVLQSPQARQAHNTRLALERSLEGDADYVLFLEDDLEFNRHLRHNLEQWPPLQNGDITLAGLYNPSLPVLACDAEGRACVVAPERVFGSQAFLLSKATVAYLVRHWDEVDGMQDIRMSRLAGRLKRPLFYHAPSLVQHQGRESVWGGPFHRSPDFDPSWKA